MPQKPETSSLVPRCVSMNSGSRPQMRVWGSLRNLCFCRLAPRKMA